MDQHNATTSQPVDAKATVHVSSDRLEAVLELSRPQHGGAGFALTQLMELLKEHGVVFGVHNKIIESLAEKPVYDCPTVVAEGHEPVNGSDAAFNYYVKLKKDLKPKDRPDGSVDFKDLGIIEQVSKGAILCEKLPASPGKPGKDVFGRSISAKAGKDKVMPMGRNTVLSEDKLKLIANMDGQIEVTDNKINVFDSFRIDGDVSPATGNIKFSGNLVITGGVLSGFLVEADGNVDIGGIVESANVKAGGTLIIRGGFTAGDSGELTAGSDAVCRFIQGGCVNVGGNLNTTYILNSTINCGGSITLTGKGLIMGGHIIARNSITANFLGSASSTAATTVEVGSAPELNKRLHELPKELTACEKNILNVEKLAKTMLQLKKAGNLTPDKAEQLKKLVDYLGQLRAAQAQLEDETERVNRQLAEVWNSMVKVCKTAYPGVKIIIGPDQFPLKSEYSYTSFRRTREGIACSPLI